MGINFSFPSLRFGNWGIKLDITFTIYCFKCFVDCFIMSISNDMSPVWPRGRRRGTRKTQQKGIEENDLFVSTNRKGGTNDL